MYTLELRQNKYIYIFTEKKNNIENKRSPILQSIEHLVITLFRAHVQMQICKGLCSLEQHWREDLVIKLEGKRDLLVFKKALKVWKSLSTSSSSPPILHVQRLKQTKLESQSYFGKHFRGGAKLKTALLT